MEFKPIKRSEDLSKLRAAAGAILRELGEDTNREGLLKTPDRVANALRAMTIGYEQNPKEVLNDAIFKESYDQMVIVRDIEIFSTCEHHLLPFFGKAHIAYIPNGKIVGLSKLGRLVDVFAKRLQVQERLTTEIANTINELLQPLGVAVVIEAKHLCMMMRGVEKQNSSAITSCMLGDFREDAKTREEFTNLLKLGSV